MGVRKYRQFSAAVEEHLIPWMKDTSARLVSIGDLQAGHSAQTHLLHNGVEAGQTNQFSSMDCVAYKSASLIFASLMLHQDDFMQEEHAIADPTKALKDPLHIKASTRAPTAKENATETLHMFREDGYVLVHRLHSRKGFMRQSTVTTDELFERLLRGMWKL
jgi:hypothetical protein